MSDPFSVVVTSISAPNQSLRDLASGCRRHGGRFYVIGDEASPRDFSLDGCRFSSIEAQRATGFEFARQCPLRHYARKNIGYLLAIRDGARVIVETDDDNIPRETFWNTRRRIHHAPLLEGSGWTNVYRFFAETRIWPRGLPLDTIRTRLPELGSLPVREVDCPIQQGLADDNPDVDAVYRLLMPLPQSFQTGRKVALSRGAWCPFNSQNTTWFPDAYPLLYLPAHCSFRMTDIWRGFVAQRIAWANGWSLLFDQPTVRQERNEHDLMRDFSDEVPGYLNNRKIGRELDGLELAPGVEMIPDNLGVCYQKLVSMGLVGAPELALLDAWLRDLKLARRGE